MGEFDIREIDAKKKQLRDLIDMFFKNDWIFDKPIEKTIIVVSFLWTGISLIKFLWSLI